jgi:hypothetical protein
VLGNCDCAWGGSCEYGIKFANGAAGIVTVDIKQGEVKGVNLSVRPSLDRSKY